MHEFVDEIPPITLSLIGATCYSVKYLPGINITQVYIWNKYYPKTNF